MAKSPGLVIQTLRGGQNDQAPPNALADDEVVLAENVEFFYSTLGERRGGMESVGLTGADVSGEDVIVHMNMHYPAQTLVKDGHFWAVGASDGASTAFSYRDANGDWFNVTPDVVPVNTFPTVFRMASQSIHNKMVFCYKSAEDRTMVWDGTDIRPMGLLAPTGTPTAANTGGAGTLSGTRVYRLRVIKKSGAVILLRSEPSDELTFAPSGTNATVTVTFSGLTLPGEGETHWELEASSGDGNFYNISEIAIATTTYVDSYQTAEEYADAGDLSEDAGDYDTVPSFHYVKADQDRLIFARQWEDEEKGSRVAWTPPWKATGVGNDERIPSATDNFIDLDWMDGGDLTGISDPLNGSFYAFKWSRIYKIQRTGRSDEAYQAMLLSTSHGALEGSIISGTDEFGKGCVYFLDPATGPMRVGVSGIQYLKNIRGTWRRMNTSAANVIAHGVYYPDKQQIHWWLAVDEADSPNLKIILHVPEVQSDRDTARRGWVTATGAITAAYCSTTVPELISDETSGSTILSYLPYAGFTSTHKIQRCDVGSTDNGEAYVARIVTKPYIVTGLMNKWGAMAAALLAAPLDTDDSQMRVKLIRDFGKETNYITTDFVAESTETSVIKAFDNLRMSSATAIQVEFTDAP